MVGKGSVSHNSRLFHAANTVPERSYLNKNYCNENIKQVYYELFDEAVNRYNKKQTRNDRVIDNYYEKIRSGKQEKLFHEIILQVGNVDDMNAQSENGQLAQKILDEYYHSFQKRNSNMRVFSAHLHMDEATPHLHIDFVPFTAGSNRGLDTRVSLKQALATQGFKGGTRQETEWNQWVLSEKQQLATVMERHGIEWEHKGTHEKHLSVYDFEKQKRAEEVEKLREVVADKKDEFDILSKRIDNFAKCEKSLADMDIKLDEDSKYQLPEPPTLISTKSYKTKFVEPLIKRLKRLTKSVLVRYFQACDDNNRLNRTNGKLYKDNEKLRSGNKKLSAENMQLKGKTSDYMLLRKTFGNKQIDSLLEQAKIMQQDKKHFVRSKNYYER